MVEWGLSTSHSFFLHLSGIELEIFQILRYAPKSPVSTYTSRHQSLCPTRKTSNREGVSTSVFAYCTDLYSREDIIARDIHHAKYIELETDDFHTDSMPFSQDVSSYSHLSLSKQTTA